MLFLICKSMLLLVKKNLVSVMICLDGVGDAIGNKKIEYISYLLYFQFI